MKHHLSDNVNNDYNMFILQQTFRFENKKIKENERRWQYC